MVEPHVGDVILSGSSETGFTLEDAMSRTLHQNLPTLQDAIAAARRHGAREMWQQNLDMRGRPIGEPIRLLLPPE